MTIYDQLSVIGPMILALSASAPIVRGHLVEWDCKWPCVAHSVDDRTPLERSLGTFPASTFSQINCYTSTTDPKLNDIRLAQHQASLELLRASGVEETLANHMAHLLARDPIAIYREQAERYGLLEQPAGSPPLLPIDASEHLYILGLYLSTIWHSVRLKMPPAMLDSSDLGWRVEFRTIEAQPRDHDNAALCTFVVCLTRAILKHNLNWLIPISLSHRNMERAWLRNAALEQSFYFPTASGQVEEMKLSEIFLGGTERRPKGLLHHVQDELPPSYFDLIAGRATGGLPTPATWMRDFCRQHPAYQHDSVVSQEICRDLMEALSQ